MKSAVFAAVALALCAFAFAPAASITDVDILNFALNLEYLEAEFYHHAVFGSGIPGALRGGGPAPIGGRKAPLSRLGLSIAREIAEDETNHVRFLRMALGKAAVKEPRINIGSAFADAADAALGTKLKPRFSPYTRSKYDLLFLHGAFIFEDVGVTAYKGAARLIADKDYLEAAAGILAVEAYHAGTIRTLLYQHYNTKVQPYNVPVVDIIAAISALRGKVGGGKDQGIVRRGGWANITPTDKSGVAFSRTTTEVVNIVTLNGASNKGGFFPRGLNGAIKG